jgi:hypothetical protein
LKARSHSQNWQPLCRLFFEPAREGVPAGTKVAAFEVTAKLLAPVTCCSLLFEYSESGGGIFGPLGLDGGRMLVCPRCHRPAGKAGICLQCGDNAFQCPKCRNINYEKLDALFCNDCGYCRFVKMETWLTCRATHERHVGGLRNEAECRQASETLEGIVRLLKNPADTAPIGRGSTAGNSPAGPASAMGGLATAEGGGGGSVTWRPAPVVPPRGDGNPGERPMLSPARRTSGAIGQVGAAESAIAATTPEETQLRLLCSALDLRQKILRCRRSIHPYASREGRAGPLSASMSSSPSASGASAASSLVLPCAGCQACVQTSLVCVLQLLARSLEATNTGTDGREAVEAWRASESRAVSPSGTRLLEDCLLPLALRCTATDARIAARRVLQALAARCLRVDRTLCAELGRHLHWTVLGASPMALRTSAEQAREETRLLLELVIAARRPTEWMCRLPLLARALGDAAPASNPLLAAGLTLPCLLLALRIAQQLQDHMPQAATNLSTWSSWRAHVYGLLFPSFAGPAPGRRGGAAREDALVARACARWQSRLRGGLRAPEDGLTVERSGMWSRSWLLEALTRASSPRVRQVAREVITALLAVQPDRSASSPGQASQVASTSSSSAALRVLDRLRASVLADDAVRPTSEAALQLAHTLLSEPGHWARRMYCVATGWLPLLRRLISEECAVLVVLPGADEHLDFSSPPGTPPLWSEVSVYPACLEASHSRLCQAESLA